MTNLGRLAGTLSDIAESEAFEQFTVQARDFLSAREQAQGGAAGTLITEQRVSFDDAAEAVNHGLTQNDSEGRSINVITPVVVPKVGRNYVGVVFWLVVAGVSGIAGLVLAAAPFIGGVALAVLLPFSLMTIGFALLSLIKSSIVSIPDGCQALITRFGKLIDVAPAGRKLLFDPFQQVGYIVNTTKEYPYNAPVREAPTAERVNASVDLFLQFRIEDPTEFIFTLGGVRGFSEKLENAISEVTRALIYEQRAEDIYDLVGEGTQGLVDTLNSQFLPAVRFTNANITHAEPSSQQYRMDLAAPEMVRVAKEAYTYEYELRLRKEQDEGAFNKELAGLREQLSGIRAEIATYQAQMDTAREKEFNRANAYARQMMVEAESSARANSALLEAQALDIRAMSSAYYPEILEYRYQHQLLDRLESVADHLPQLVTVGDGREQRLDLMNVARQLMGATDDTLFSDSDMQKIREQMSQIVSRVQERNKRIETLMEEEQKQLPGTVGMLGNGSTDVDALTPETAEEAAQ